jgi:sporulation protein YlmC with PRC-barrel domain
MLRRLVLTAVLSLALVAPAAHAASVTGLLGQPITGLKGQNVGIVEDLILDVQAGRVLYVIVQGTQQHYTVPIRGLYRTPGNGALRLDMDIEGESARISPQADPRFRRAGPLLGQGVEQPGDGTIGTILDIAFDPGSGEIERVIVATPEGERALPPAALAQGRFPPITLWPQEESPAAGR